MEKDEQEKYLRERRRKINLQLNAHKKKQQNELEALKQRIMSGQEEQSKVRATELERLLQKYQNVKKELEIQQQNEENKLVKYLSNPGCISSKFESHFNRSFATSPKLADGDTNEGLNDMEYY